MPEATLPTIDELKRLPLLAIVAYAVRCARRVQPLYGLARGIPHGEKHQAAIETALMIGEQFCRGEPIAASHTARAAYAAADAAAFAARSAHDAARSACVANVAADDASRAAYAADDAARSAYAAAHFADHARSAAHAARVAAAYAAAASRAAYATDEARRSAADAAARADYERLCALHPVETRTLGSPLDSSEQGPLGPLWPNGPPDWFRPGRAGPVGG